MSLTNTFEGLNTSTNNTSDSEIEDLLEELTTDSSVSSNQIKYINRVPKINVNNYSIITNPNNKRLSIYVDNTDKPIIKSLLNNSAQLQNKHKLYWVDEQQLTTLIRDIIQTTGKYVYPMIFVNYLKQSLSINEKINFDNNLLLYIRIWSNQIREIARQSSSLSLLHNQIIHNHDIRYIGYKICCELLYYYMNIYKKQQ